MTFLLGTINEDGLSENSLMSNSDNETNSPAIKLGLAEQLKKMNEKPIEVRN